MCQELRFIICIYYDFYQGDLFMIFYPLDYVVDEVKKNEPSKEQLLLKKYAGSYYTKEEAGYIWERVLDHKWYIGERLKRDVGFRVATVDFIENFYDEKMFSKNNRTNFSNRTFGQLNRLVKTYLVSKSFVING